jgi:RNA polymerase sigma factor (sigma-70 family)
MNARASTITYGLMIDDPEPDLVEAAARRDEAACRELVLRAEGLIRAVVRQGGYYVENPTDEEELRQEVRVQMLRSIESWDPERGSFVSWVYGIGRNVLNSFLREQRRRPREESFEEQGEGFEPADTLRPLPGDLPEVPKLVGALWRVVERMAPEDQEVVRHLLNGDPHSVLAKSLGVSEAAAKQRAYRMRNRLRAEFQGYLSGALRDEVSKVPKLGITRRAISDQ